MTRSGNVEGPGPSGTDRLPLDAHFAASVVSVDGHVDRRISVDVRKRELVREQAILAIENRGRDAFPYRGRFAAAGRNEHLETGHAYAEVGGHGRVDEQGEGRARLTSTSEQQTRRQAGTGDFHGGGGGDEVTVRVPVVVDDA